MPAGTLLNGRCCPAIGAVKINSDAHIGADGFMGLGVSIRDEKGCIIAAAVVQRVDARWDVEFVEVADREWVGVLIAHQMGLMKIELEGNMHNVVHKLNMKLQGTFL